MRRRPSRSSGAAKLMTRSPGGGAGSRGTATSHRRWTGRRGAPPPAAGRSRATRAPPPPPQVGRERRALARSRLGEPLPELPAAAVDADLVTRLGIDERELAD